MTIVDRELFRQRLGGLESVPEGFGFHLESIFKYRNETFLYSLILVVLVYSIINYKMLTNIGENKTSNTAENKASKIDEKKASKKGTKWYEVGWKD